MKIEKNELKQVKSFFKFAKKEYQYSKGKWDPNAYLTIEATVEHVYIAIQYHTSDDNKNPKILRLKLVNQELCPIESLIVLPINFIDVLETSPELIIDEEKRTINSIAISEELPQSHLLDHGTAIIEVEKYCLLTMNQDKYKDFKNFITSNKTSTKERETFKYFYLEDLDKPKSTIQFTDGKRLNLLEQYFNIDSIKTILSEQKKLFIHQDYLKLLIPLMDTAIKNRDEIEIFIEYGKYMKDDRYLDYKTDIELRTFTQGIGRRLIFSFSIPGEQIDNFPLTDRVMAHNKEKESLIEILLDPKAKSELKKIETLKSYLHAGVQIEIEKENIKLTGSMIIKDDTIGSFEIDLTHLACIENRSPEPVKLRLPTSNFLSMIKEIGERTATLIINSIVDPIIYSTSTTEGLCTVMRPM